MDVFSGKRSAGRLVTPKKGYNVACKDVATERDKNVQFCNRIGCSGRIKYCQNMKFGTSDKSQCSKLSFRSLNGNERVGTYSRSNSAVISAKKSNYESKRKSSSQSEIDLPESSLSGDSEAPEPMSSPCESPVGYKSESMMNKSGKVTGTVIGGSSLLSSTRPQRVFQTKSGSHKQNTLPASSVPLFSKSSGPGPLSNSNGNRYGLRNLKCNSMPDVVPPSYSSTSSKSIGKNIVKKKSPEDESSLSRRGRKTTAASSVDGPVFPSTSGISISNSRHDICTSGNNDSGATSVRTRRSVNISNRMRVSYRQNRRNSSSAREPAAGSSQFPETEMPFNVGGPNSTHHFSSNVFSSGSSSYSLSSSNGDNPSTLMPFTSDDLDFTHLRNCDAFQRFNMDGIAEVLLALERIEQDEELTHEQVLALETSFFLSGLNLYDQHRDMRLDIDNMSYEELLALEERMGTVSTAVSEETLLKCLRRSIYQVTTPAEVQVTGSGKDGRDIKCSICQDEFSPGDEIGKLVECHHGFHVTCINQWLRLKNWCPICKVSAVPSHSSSS